MSNQIEVSDVMNRHHPLFHFHLKPPIYSWKVVRLRDETAALNRELGEARGAREEMLRIYSRHMSFS